MKTYLKIFVITAGIQMLGFFLTYCLDQVLSCSGSSTIAPVLIAGLFVIISMTVGLILAFIWFQSWKERILTILLLPTNYVWMLFVIAVIRLVKGMLDIFENIPANFG